jgi:uncharacterized protein involved in exopolysaccharide biosynthesis
MVSGLGGQETYGAESRLIVGRVDVEASAVPGVTAAFNTLAGTYSRLVAADDIKRRVLEKFGVSVLRGTISASPIPESPVIRIEVRASSPAQATKLADAAATALIDYVHELNTSASADADRILTDFGVASAELAAATTRRDADRAQGLPGAVALSNDEATVARAQQRSQALSSLYVATLSRTQGSDIIRIVNRAGSTGGNRSARLKLTIGAGLAVGLLFSLALATLLANQTGRGRGGEPPVNSWFGAAPWSQRGRVLSNGAPVATARRR